MKIAFLCSRFPYPLEKGDKLRAYHQIVALSKRGHQVGLFCLSEKPVPSADLQQMKAFCHTIEVFPLSLQDRMLGMGKALFSGLPFQLGYFLKPAAKKEMVARLKAFQPDHLFCQLIRMAEYAKAWPGRKTLDYMDAFSFIFQTRAEKASGLKRALLVAERDRLVRYEEQVFSCFDQHLIISQRDRQQLPVSEKEDITVVPNGVDVDYFSPHGQLEKEQDVVFVGNLGYHPNVEAVQWFHRKVYPLLLQERPNIRILIAGARPSSRIKSLANEHISVSGWLPDIREAYGSGKVFVAPLFHGGGQQNKLLEAMSMELPCITTHRVNASLGASAGKVLIEAETGPSFAKAILLLLASKEKRREMGKAGRVFVEENYSWEKSAELLEQAIQLSGSVPFQDES